jgi:integrase/recombinase XerD
MAYSLDSQQKVWILSKFGFLNKSKIWDLLSHSRAMHLYQHGMDLTLISQWLGHAQLDTTLIYAHADTEQKRKAIEQATPPDSPLKNHLNAEKYQVTDDDLLKRLYGLK